MVDVIGSLLFLAFLPVWTLFIGTLGIPLMLFDKPITQLVGKVWSRGVLLALRIFCRIRHETRGLEHIPNSPYILACKHQSAWDTIVFLAYVKQISYIYKKELGSIPIYGNYLPRMGMLGVDRSGKMAALRDMVRNARERLKDGFTIIIFPEGTRTAVGQQVDYQIGITALYHECHVPIVPVALNSGLFWPKTSFIKRPGKIILEYLPAIPPGLHRKEFMSTLFNSIETKTRELEKLR